MHGWVLVLMVWRMLELVERPTLRNAIIAGCATAFAMWWTPYFILIGGAGWAALALTAIVVGLVRGRALRRRGALLYRWCRSPCSTARSAC